MFAKHTTMPRKDRSWYKLQTDLAHLFNYVWHLAVRYCQRRIGRYVTTRRASSARGEHQMATHFIHQLTQRMLDDRLLVGD